MATMKLKVDAKLNDELWTPQIIAVNKRPFVVEHPPKFEKKDYSDFDLEDLADLTPEDIERHHHTHSLLLRGLRQTIELFFIYKETPPNIPADIFVTYEQVGGTLTGFTDYAGRLHLGDEVIVLLDVIEKNTAPDDREAILGCN